MPLIFSNNATEIQMKNCTCTCIPYLITAGRVITGRVGTIKRKKQLRGVLKSIDSGYHDNLFDSTPIQKKTQHIVVN